MDFVICGVQKAGTTALDNYLRQHPRIVMSRAKETHFFDTDERFANPVQPIDFAPLHASFELRADDDLAGEATPISSFWHPVARRLWEYNPDLKLVITLRNPITRAFSHWHMERERGLEPLDFIDALRAEAARASTGQDRTYSYVARGRYVEQLRRLWRFFPRAQTHVIRHDDLTDQTQATIDGVVRFLGAVAVPIDARVEGNRQTYRRSLGREELDDLHRRLDPEIEALAELIDWNLDDWLGFSC